MSLISLSPSKYLSQSWKENRHLDPVEDFQIDLKKISSSYQMTLDERIQCLEAWKNRYKCTEDDPTAKRIFKRINAKLTELKQEEKSAQERTDYQTQLHVNKITENREHCIDYALLDSSPDLHLSFEGLSEGQAQQYFLARLRDLQKEHSYQEVECLITALEHMYQLLIYRNECKQDRFLKRPIHLYKTQVWSQLKELQSGKTAYFFLPLSTDDHALTAKVEWISHTYYRLTIVNTGEGAPFRESSYTQDLVYQGLTIDEMINLVPVFVRSYPHTSDLYQTLQSAIPERIRIPNVGRKHKMQRGNSCSIQALSKLIHGILSDHIYWAFKVKTTTSALNDLEPGPRRDALVRLLNKREGKLRLSLNRLPV